MKFRIMSIMLGALLTFAASEASAQWRSVPFDATNFTADSPMTWTVALANQQTFKYVVNDRTMTVAVQLQQTTVSGTATQRLYIKIPGGYKAGSAMTSPAFIRVDSGSPFVEVVYAGTFPNTNTIQLFRTSTAVQQLSTNGTYVYFTITFDVCQDEIDSCP